MRVGLVTATVEDSAGVVEIHRAKERGLLGLLALTPGRVVSVDRLIDGLWGEDPPRTAAKTLQTYIKNLRGHIASSGAARDTLRTDPPGYLLAIDPADVDLLRFDAHCHSAASAATSGHLAEADRIYADALGMVAEGDLTVFDAPGLDGAAVRFREQRRRAVDEHIDVQLELGRHGELISLLASRVETEVGNERCWAQLMTALYRSGRQRDALQTFATARDRLRNEFGLAPGHTLVELEAHILRQDLPPPGQRIAAADAPIVSPAPHAAIALTFTVAETSAEGAAELAAQVHEPAAAIEHGPTPAGYRVVVSDVETAILLAYRLSRRADGVRVVAVRDGIASEAAMVESLLDHGATIIFAEEIGADLARRRWSRSELGWVAPEAPPLSLRIPTALERLRHRTATYVTRASDDAIHDFMVSLRQGERRTIRLNGPAGIGKSSWLAHAAAAMTAQKCAVLYCQARETDTGAHAALVDAAYQAVMLLDRHELEDHVATHGFALTDLVPEIQPRVGASTTASTATVAAAEVDAALIDLFQRLSRNVPTVLLLDDAPLLTDESVRLVTRLVTDRRTGTLGLVAACRSQDPQTPMLAPALADLCAGHAVELQQFSVEQTARFLESVAGLDRSPRTLQVAELVNQSTLGLPLFVREIAHDLTQSSEWFTSAGKFRIDRTPDNLVLPTSLHELLRRRLDRLDAEAQTLASVGAVFGEFSTLLVATVSELPVSDVLGALDRLIEQRVIEPIPGLADHYHFAHPMLREAALRDIGAARTAAIALAAAEYLSAQPTPSARQMDRRAELWFRALPLAPLDRVEAELDKAAEAAHARKDHYQRIVHLRRRIQITESAGQSVPIVTRVDLAEASADAQIEAGVRRQRSRVAFDAAADIGDGALMARAALAFGGPFNPFGSLVTVDEESESMARRALAMGNTSLELQAQLWGMVAAAASDVTGAADEITTALRFAKQAENPLLLGHLLSLAHALESSANPITERIATNWQIIRTGQQHNDRSLELQGWGWMVADAFETGEFTLMDHAAENRARLAERLHDTTYKWSDLVYQGMRAMIAGRFSEAETTLWEALEVGRLPLGDHANRFFGLQLLKLSEMRGQGQPMLAPAQDYAEQFGYVTAYVSLAHLHAELGHLTDAGDLVEAHVPDNLGALLNTYDRLPTLALLARIAQLRGDATLGGAITTELAPAAGHLCVHADAVLYGSVDHNLGRCALACGDGHSALEWLERSEQTYIDLGASVWLLLLQADRCDALDLVGEHERADEERAKLLARAADMGLAVNGSTP